jgi:hypothetical protein
MITRRGLTNGVLQAPLSDEKAIRALFKNGEQGVWYDPSDLSTLFQDAAGTTPVTAMGQPVGLMLDKSGRGNHATQSTSASRPILQQDADGRFYLSCDGVDDGMATASIDFTATDKMTVWAGIRKLSDAATGIVAELSSTANSNNGTFYLVAPLGGATVSSSFRGTSQTFLTVSGLASPISCIITFTGNIAAPMHYIKANAITPISSSISLGSGNYGNYLLYLFRRGGATLPFNGNFYGMVIRGAQSNPKQISQVEKYLAAKTGVSL